MKMDGWMAMDGYGIVKSSMDGWIKNGWM